MEEISQLMRKAQGSPYCAVLSRQALQQVRLHASSTDHLWNQDDHFGDVRPLMGMQLHEVPDIPEREVVVFYDPDAFIRYAELQQRLGHCAAIQRMQAAIDDGLIQKAKLNALMNPS